MELTWAYLLIALGFGLIGGELFFPTGGLWFIAAVVAIVAGIALVFIYGGTNTGLLTTLLVGIAGPLAFALAINLWPKTALGRSMISAGPSEDETLASMPANLELEQLRGRHGQALSDLRPAGAVSFDGKRIDVLSEGPMIPAGAWVKCIDVKPGRVVVRQATAPDLDNIELNDLNS
jgi:membrane-bound ClpP family serine protease